LEEEAEVGEFWHAELGRVLEEAKRKQAKRKEAKRKEAKRKEAKRKEAKVTRQGFEPWTFGL
jgi:hypothetical protein